jgi:Ca2+-binding EF-hand superfamily protein
MSEMADWEREKFSYFFRCLDQSNNQALELNDLMRVAEAFRTAHGWDEEEDQFIAITLRLTEFWRVLILCSDADGSGDISLEEFLIFFGATRDMTRGFKGLIPPWAKNLVEILLGSMDRDGDDQVSLQEYQEYLIAIGSHMHASSAFDRLDLDDSGYIEVTEFEALMAEYLSSSDRDAPGNQLVTGGWPD